MMIPSFFNCRLRGLLLAISQVGNSLINRLYTSINSKVVKYGVREAGNIVVGRHFICRYPANICLGEKIIIGNNNKWITELPDATMVIKDHVSIGDNVTIDFSGSVTIQREAHIAHGVYVITHDHGHNYHNRPRGKSLEIGENAFIGVKAMILPNVYHIGKNSIIGAGAVVTRDVPDNAIVVGNPAKILKYRDDI